MARPARPISTGPRLEALHEVFTARTIGLTPRRLVCKRVVARAPGRSAQGFLGCCPGRSRRPHCGTPLFRPVGFCAAGNPVASPQLRDLSGHARVAACPYEPETPCDPLLPTGYGTPIGALPSTAAARRTGWIRCCPRNRPCRGAMSRFFRARRGRCLRGRIAAHQDRWPHRPRGRRPWATSCRIRGCRISRQSTARPSSRDPRRRFSRHWPVLYSRPDNEDPLKGN